MTTIRVILADDHPITRDGIRNLLERAPGIEVVGEADNGAEALRLIEELTPDVLLLDMEMPGLKGIDVARQLQAGSSPVRILALSAYDDKQYILELLASGAAGYLVKEEAPEAIIEAVRGVAQGQQGWVSRRIAAQMMAWTREEPPKTNLTDREMGVLRLVAAGKTNQEIGLALGISDKTVEKHLEAIFAKLGVASRVEAAVWAVRAGWV
jgi:DNA-binding NarL/FixJ family response regulator